MNKPKVFPSFVVAIVTLALTIPTVYGDINVRLMGYWSFDDVPASLGIDQDDADR